jgi:hypothetical protein
MKVTVEKWITESQTMYGKSVITVTTYSSRLLTMVDYILHIAFAKFKSREGLPGNPSNDNPNENNPRH